MSISRLRLVLGYVEVLPAIAVPARFAIALKRVQTPQT
jgi:hypothetical protein